MKCQDCKYWKGEKTIIGRECLNPQKQQIWKEKEERYIRLGYANTTVTAKYKYATAPACKCFEARFSGKRVVIEPCYMVSLIDENGEVLKSELSVGIKEDARKLGDRMLLGGVE